MTPVGAEPIAKRNIFVNAHFRIEPCASCPIPGYLIVSPRVPVSSLAELSPDAQAALGATLVAATRTIEAVVHPQRVLLRAFRRRDALGPLSPVSSIRMVAVVVFPCSPGRYRDIWPAAHGLGTPNVSEANYRYAQR